MCTYEVVLICLMFALGLVPAARGDTVYTYTGQPFTAFSGSYSCVNGVGECGLSGSVTYSSPLPPNTFPNFVAPTPLSFSFTDGVHIISSATIAAAHGSSNPDCCFAHFGFETGPDGKILAWGFSLSAPMGSSTLGFGSSADLTTGIFAADSSVVLTPVPGGALITASAQSTPVQVPGTWTMSTVPPSAVPEPSNLLLLGFGLLGVIGRLNQMPKRNFRR